LSAFVEPSLSENLIPEAVWEEWERKTLPLNEWRREFQAVLSADNKFATFEDIKKEAKFLDNADAFRTPGKRKRDLEGDDILTMGEVKTLKYERVLPAEQEELRKIVDYGGMKKGTLTGIVSGLESSMILANEGLEEVALITAARFQSNKDSIGMVSGVIQNVRSVIGSQVEMGSLFTAPTMWGTLSLVTDELTRVGTALQEFVDKNFVAFKRNTEMSFAAAKANRDTLAQVLTTNLKTLKGLTQENIAIQAMVSE
jgi:hypothetical protein